MLKKLMFVEQDQELLNIYVATFQELDNVKILVALDGQSAINIIDRVQPDVLVQCLAMPKMDGYQVLEHIRDKGYTVSVIMVTNFDLPEYKKRAKELGATEYHVKKDQTMRTLKPIIMKYIN